MKVLHVIPSMDHADGGPTEIVLGICRNLLKGEQVDVEIATTVASGQTRGSAAAGAEAASAEVPVRTFPRTFSRAWKYSRPLGKWLRRHVADYDVIHAHSVFTYATRAACRAAFQAGVPVVVTTHGMLAPFSRRHKFLRKFFYWHLIEKHNLARASSIHASAPIEQVELEQLLPGRRVDCVILGLDQVAWEHPKCEGAFRSRFGIPEDRLLLLYLSRIHSKKGLLDMLLPALARLPAEVHLAVVGESDAGQPEQERLIRAATQRLGLNGRVTFAGPIYGHQKWAAYDDSDVYVLPSLHENFGITVIEAMARGVPCVVSPGVQSAQFVREARAGLIVAREVKALASELARLLAAPRSQREEMGRRGREFVQRELTWAQTARRMAALYRDIVRSPGVGQ